MSLSSVLVQRLKNRGWFSAPATLLVLSLFAVFLVAPQNVARAADDTGSLTIIKNEGEGDLEDLPAPKPMSNVTFRIKLLQGLNASSQQELGELSKKNPWLLTSEPGYELGPEINAVTDAAGRAYFPGLPRGVYVVQEVPDHKAHPQHSLVTPFLVAVPDSQGNPNVEVHAKNQVLVSQKTAEITETAGGDLVTYRISSQVPAPDRRGKLYQFIVEDTLSEHLGLVAEPIVRIHKPAGITALKANEDFEYAYDAPSRKLKVELTQQGLETLARERVGHPETLVEVAVPTKVSANAPEGERIKNTAYVYPDGYGYAVMGAYGIATTTAEIVIKGDKPLPIDDPWVPWPWFPFFPIIWFPIPGSSDGSGPGSDSGSQGSGGGSSTGSSGGSSIGTGSGTTGSVSGSSGSTSGSAAGSIIWSDLNPCPTCVPCEDCFGAPGSSSGGFSWHRLSSRLGRQAGEITFATKDFLHRITNFLKIHWWWLLPLLLLILAVLLWLLWRRRNREDNPPGESIGDDT